MYTTAVNDLMLLFLFLMIGVVLRQIIKPLRKLYLPSGLIGGAAALIMGPQVLNLFAMPDTWSSMASPMINIVPVSYTHLDVYKRQVWGFGWDVLHSA